MKKVILKYSLIGGLGIVAYLNLMYETGIMYSASQWSYLATLTIVIMPIVIFFALRELKNKHYGGRLPFIQALISGVLIAQLGMVVYCLFDYMNVHFFNFRMNREMIEITLEQMKQQGKNAEEIAKREAEIKARYADMEHYLNTFWWYLKWGAVYSIVAYILLNFNYLKKIYNDKKFTKNSTPV